MEANRILTMSLQDIVFDGRNKSYGAYELRSAYEKRLLKALLMGGLILIFSAVAPYAYACLASVVIPKQESTTVVDITPIKLDETILPPPKPLLKEESLPPKRTMIFVPPVVIADNEVKVENPPIENEKLVDDISTKTQTSVSQVIAMPEEEAAPAIESKNAPIETVDAVIENYSLEKPAEFPGGATELMKWLSNNVKYPADARDAGIHGRVVLKFIVEKDGSISQVKTLKGVHELLDREAVRVTQSMPTWKAGQQGGKAVRCYFTLPINFTLQ